MKPLTQNTHSRHDGSFLSSCSCAQFFACSAPLTRTVLRTTSSPQPQVCESFSRDHECSDYHRVGFSFFGRHTSFRSVVLAQFGLCMVPSYAPVFAAFAPCAEICGSQRPSSVRHAPFVRISTQSERIFTHASPSLFSLPLLTPFPNPTATANHALQRTAPGVTACAPTRRPAPATFPHRLRRPPQSLSLGSLGVARLSLCPVS
jgi:hypothetical protein